MTDSKLIELYGRRFTPFAKIVAFILTVILGIVIAVSQNNQNGMNESGPAVEHSRLE